MSTSGTRRISPLRAFIAGFLGFGLGYVYVGRIRSALLSVLGSFGVLLVLSWTRVIVNSAVGYWIGAVTIVIVALANLVHPIVIAAQCREQPNLAFNMWWMYVLWVIAIGAASYSILMNRQMLLGYGTFRTASASMSPTLEKNDFFMANTWRYNNHDPQAGEIVILEKPGEPGVTYVKRVVGVGGDTIALHSGILYRNGQTIVESYLHTASQGSSYGREFSRSLVPADAVFVMGDFRDNSLDSRTWGPVPISNLRGRAEYIWFSISRGRLNWSRIGLPLEP